MTTASRRVYIYARFTKASPIDRLLLLVVTCWRSVGWVLFAFQLLGTGLVGGLKLKLLLGAWSLMSPKLLDAAQKLRAGQITDL